MSENERTRHWRSIEDLAEGETGSPEKAREFATGESGATLAEVSRRNFLGVMGAGAALASAAIVPGCVRKPVEHIVPYHTRPEDLIPGKPMFFRTAFNVGDAVLGLHVESHEGRPTKVEGNPAHPMSLGKASVWAQSSVLDLYDPNRSNSPLHKGEAATWEQAKAAIAANMKGFGAAGGGLAVVVDAKPSRSLRAMLDRLRAKYPGVRVFQHDNAWSSSEADGLAAVGAANHRVSYNLFESAPKGPPKVQAKVVVVLDGDPLGSEGDTVRNSAGYAGGRRLRKSTDAMNRLYVMEPAFTVTGMSADSRLRVSSSHASEAMRALAGHVLKGSRLGSEISARHERTPGGIVYKDDFKRFVDAAAKDLLAQPRGSTAVIAGDRQPAWVHGLAALVNHALGNTGVTVRYAKDQRVRVDGTLVDLAASISANTVNTLVVLGGDPVYDAPADLDFGALIKGREHLQTIHLGEHVGRTGKLATWHLPKSHYLEAWGDLVAADGTVTVQQPLIAPMHGTISEIETLALLVGDPIDGYKIVKRTLQGRRTPEQWRRALHDGVLETGDSARVRPTFNATRLRRLLASAQVPASRRVSSLEMNFVIDAAACDGRYANNAWLQELPDPLTKIVWDNAACVSPKTARELGLQSGDMARLKWKGRTLETAIWVAPGTADNVVVLSLGYGRTAEDDLTFAEGRGFDAYSLRTSDALWAGTGATIEKTGAKYELVTTQEYGSMVDPLTRVKREVVREARLTQYAENPKFVDSAEVWVERDGEGKITGLRDVTSPWTPPVHKTAAGEDIDQAKVQQWAMVIDLTVCTGCNACTVACQAENNIPVVGKERCANGREMHWIRMDRYFTGSPEDPEAVVQPMPCAQCEMAPCENVCPVAATTHSPEGLNDMAYNRCIGTRYCSNNCPFKVRRFNFFNYNKENRELAPTWGMQKNPDVTVRFRGVMEKCTYCVQRIQQAKIEAKRSRPDGKVPDGHITTACEQTCPTGAIVFGDKNQAGSRVAELRQVDRNYELLRELNLHARTTYLAKVRNPNPDLVPEKKG